MPLLAKLIGAVAVFLTGFLARFFAFGVALKLASYTVWIAVFGTFLVTVFVCVQNLVGMVSGGTGSGPGWVHFFLMGVGMFVPANAGAVMSCVGSVWIATSVFKIQRRGIENFTK